MRGEASVKSRKSCKSEKEKVSKKEKKQLDEKVTETNGQKPRERRGG
jgi:hypothetical protein